MIEIGKFKSVAPNASMEGLLTENTALKKREANLKLVIAVGVIAALGYYFYKSKKKEVRIVDPESDNLNTIKDEKFH
jgi:hypothetical protein